MLKGFVPYPPLQIDKVTQWAAYVQKKATSERRLAISVGSAIGHSTRGAMWRKSER